MASGRKRPILRYEFAGAQTRGSPESQPRQLQALVSQRSLTRGGQKKRGLLEEAPDPAVRLARLGED